MTNTDFRAWEADLESEIQTLANKHNITPAEDARLDQALNELEEVRTVLARDKRLKEMRDQQAAMGKKVAARGVAGIPERAIVRPEGFNANTLSGRDPWTDGDSFRDVRSKALAAIERSSDLTDHGRNVLDAMLLDDDTDETRTASFIVAGTDPDVCSAYEKFLSNPMGAAMTFTPGEARAWAAYNEFSERSALTTTGVTSLVPVPFDPSVVLTDDSVSDPLRRMCRVAQTTASTFRISYADSPSAAYAAEGTEVDDNTPTISSKTMTPQRAHSFIAATFEAVEDSTLAQNVSEMLASARQTLEANKFLFGTGTGANEPWGLLTRLVASSTSCEVLGSSGAATSADLVLADLYALDNDLPERAHAAGASWLMHRSYGNKIRELASQQASAQGIWQDLGAGQPSLLLGRPVYYASGMESVSTTVSGSSDQVIVYGAFGVGGVIVDRLPTQVTWYPYIVGSNGRPNGTGGWYARFRNTFDTIGEGTYFRYLTL